MAVRIWTGETDGDWATATNWVGDTGPSNGDSVIVPADITQGIDGYDASAVTLVGFTVEDGYVGTIGSKANGVVTPVKITLLNSAVYYNAILGGTGETYLDVTDYSKIIVRRAAASPGPGEYGLNLSGAVDGTGTGEVYIETTSGSVGLGGVLNEDLEVNKVYISGAPVDVCIGANVTKNDDSSAPDMDIQGGNIYTRCALGTVDMIGGQWHHERAGAVTAITTTGGDVVYEGSGTITTLTVSENGIVDFDKNLQGRTVTNCVVAKGAAIYDNHKTVTWTNGLDVTRCRLPDVTLNLGKNFTITPSAI